MATTTQAMHCLSLRKAGFGKMKPIGRSAKQDRSSSNWTVNLSATLLTKSRLVPPRNRLATCPVQNGCAAKSVVASCSMSSVSKARNWMQPYHFRRSVFVIRCCSPTGPSATGDAVTGTSISAMTYLERNGRGVCLPKITAIMHSTDLIMSVAISAPRRSLWPLLNTRTCLD